MTWNYRILQDEDGFALHEVHYDRAGNPYAYTETPITFECDPEEGPEGIIQSLRLALRDAEEKPVLRKEDFGGP